MLFALVGMFSFTVFAMEIRQDITSLRLGWSFDFTAIIRPITEWRFATIMCLQERLDCSAASIDAGRAVWVFFGLCL